LQKAINIYFITYLLIYALLIGSLFTSCTVTKYLPSPTVTTKDSIVYKHDTVTLRVPPTIIPGDTVKLTETVPCPDAVWRGTAISKNGRTSVKASLNKGLLSVECKMDSIIQENDSLRAVILSKETFHDKTTVLPPVIEHDRYIPWWMYLVIGVSVLIALLALFKR